QTEFYMIDVNGSIPSALVDQLDNGKGLSLFFQEATNIVDSSNEWSMTSKNNVCIVTYAYTSSLSNGLEAVAVADKMVSTQRLEYVANLVGDVVLGVQGKCVKSKRKQCLRHLAQVDVSGFGLGAHIAGRTCQYLKRKLRQRVRILL
ncbi:uncharacterized protein LOC116351624, partial [Contarinia nasturtii]|uniref:uncharacterized protein LOC116351624 n=1 Tax=Contarinia nasturtii TaxID=265458 RepID=UPI0012D4813B